jgi:hypothetical protein
VGRRNHFRNTQRRQYRSGAYTNPYFRRNEKSFLIASVPIIVGAVVVTFVVGILLLHPGFRITNVSVNGLDKFDESLFEQTIRDTLSSRVVFIFGRSSRFLFSSEDLKENLEKHFVFESIDVRLQGREVTINIIEKQSQILWKSGENLLLVDVSGIIIRELSKEERDLLARERGDTESKDAKTLRELPVFVDRNKIEVHVGDSIFTPDEVEAIFRFHAHLLVQGIVFTETHVDRLAGKWMGVRTQDGFDILFDATADIDAQARNLQTLFREQIEDPKKLEYIDLRFGDHVYFQ